MSRDPAAWRSADMKTTQNWFVQLTNEQSDDILQAAQATMDANIAIHEISSDNFPVKITRDLLESIRAQVVDGYGFMLIRGLDVLGKDRELVMRAYFGVGAFIGVARPQNRMGHMIGHVKDLGEDKSDPKTRIYRTNGRQRFHVDSADIVGLLCLHPSKSGGASAICSSVAIMDHIRNTRPDLADTLAAPFIYDRKGEVPEGKQETYEIPILHSFQGKDSIYFARDFIESAQKRFPDLPRLSAKQIEALDLVEALAESPEFCLDMDFQPGDMQFVHNHVLLHSRTAYEDYAEPEKRRHLLRLWLSAHGGRPLPPIFEERYGPINPGQPRGGITVKDYIPQVPLDAE